MTNSIIWKIEKILIAFLISISFIVQLIKWDTYVFFSLITLFIVLLGGCFCSFKRNYLICHLISLYAIIIGPVNILVSRIKPDSLVSARLLLINTDLLFNDTNLIFKYSLQLELFYIVLFFFIMSTPLIPFRKLSTGKIKNHFPNAPMISAFLFGLFEYCIRTRFFLNIPGHMPTIGGAGIIIYIMESIDYCLLYLILYENVLSKDELSTKTIIKVMTGIVFTHLASILIGQRGPVLRGFILVTIVIAIKNFDHQPSLQINRSKAIKIIIGLGAFALIVLGVANYYRTGVFYSILFILQRITGLFDGLIVMDYFKGDIAPFHISEYFTNIFTGQGTTPNYYYTHVILGYPSTAIHGSAAPIFISSWMYGGMIGVVVVGSVVGILIGLANKGIKRINIRLYSASKDQQKLLYAQLYALLMLTFIVFTAQIIDGDVTNIKPAVVALTTYILIRITI